MNKSIEPLIQALNRFLQDYFGLSETGLIEIPRLFEGNKKANINSHSKKKDDDMIVLHSCCSRELYRCMGYIEGAFKTYITLNYKKGDGINPINWVQRPILVETLDIEGGTLYQICLRAIITLKSKEHIHEKQS